MDFTQPQSSSGHAPTILFLAWPLCALLIVYAVSKVLASWKKNRPLRGIPLVALDGKTPKDSWIHHGNETLRKGYDLYGDQPFQVMTGSGPKLILRNKYVDEISKIKAFSSVESNRLDFFVDYHGFEGVKYSINNARMLPDVVRMKLTQSLGLVTEDLAEESVDTLHDIFGENPDWQVSTIKADVLQLVARLSSRVFLGKPLCQDQRWLDIAKDYTVLIFTASQQMREMSWLWRPIQYQFRPTCKRLRETYHDAQTLVAEEVERRKNEANRLLAMNKTPAKKSDAIAWITEVQRGISTEELVQAQLSLTVAAIHTTSEAACMALQHLCSNPHLFESLRNEIISVVSKDGWRKTTLYNLKLLDSFLKESQRFGKGHHVLMRAATDDVVLSDGTKISKGTRLECEARFWDPRIYPDPERFDAYRYVEKNKHPGQAGRWNYTSVTSEFNGFGQGEHACPGAFPSPLLRCPIERLLTLCHGQEGSLSPTS